MEVLTKMKGWNVGPGHNEELKMWVQAIMNTGISFQGMIKNVSPGYGIMRPSIDTLGMNLWNQD